MSKNGYIYSMKLIRLRLMPATGMAFVACLVAKVPTLLT